MGGIVYVLCLFLAFVTYCVLIYLPIRWANKRGITGRKRLYIGIAGFIVVTLWFFGKNVISYTAFRYYYCKYEAGMTVYKTLEQWQQENPGVWETLKPINDSMNYRDREKYPDVALEREFNGNVYKVSSAGNQRIISYSRSEYPFWGAIDKEIYLLWDNKTQEVLAKQQFFRWRNTWDTTPDKDGWRGPSYLGNECCKPEYWEYSDYKYSFSNFNVTQEEK